MTTLHPTAALGAPASAGVFLLEEDTALYPVGRRLATASLETRQEFDFLDEAPAGVQALTAMALAPDRRCVAICERWAGATAGAKATAKVRVFHLPRRRTAVTLSAPVDGDFVGCTFSADGKFLVAERLGALTDAEARIAHLHASSHAQLATEKHLGRRLEWTEYTWVARRICHIMSDLRQEFRVQLEPPRAAQVHRERSSSGLEPRTSY